MLRFAFTLAMSAVVLAPGARTKSPAAQADRSASETTAASTDGQDAQRSGYIIASS